MAFILKELRFNSKNGMPLFVCRKPGSGFMVAEGLPQILVFEGDALATGKYLAERSAKDDGVKRLDPAHFIELVDALE